MGRATGKATVRQRQDGMNGTEAAYAQQVLATRVRDGTYLRWDYQPERLVLAKNTQYTPDFRVLLPDGTVEFHEVKGFWRDDARVKMKVVAELHPYVFRIVTKAKKPRWGWDIEEVVP